MSIAQAAEGNVRFAAESRHSRARFLTSGLQDPKLKSQVPVPSDRMAGDTRGEVVMFRVALSVAVIFVGVLAGIGAASSHPVYLDEGYHAGYGFAPLYAEPVPPPAYAAPPASVVVVPAPPVEIYVAPAPVPFAHPDAGPVYVRPANCGVYRYWDGIECVDARDFPPPLGGY